MNDAGSSNKRRTPAQPPARRRRRTRPRRTWANFYVEMALADALVSGVGLSNIKAMEAHLRLALRYERDHPEALNLMAQLCAQTGRHAEALDYLKRAIRSITAREDPPEPAARAVAYLAGIYEELGQYERAIEVYELGLAWQERAEFYNGRGYCRLKLGNPAAALADARRAIELCPDNQAYTNDYGYALFEAGDLVQARQVLRRAVAMDPRDDLARNNLLLCEQALKQARPSRRTTHPDRRRGRPGPTCMGQPP